MAYAQLAGMPAYFGLYAASLPVMVAAIWGSWNQLGTGPVAVVSLLTASALTPLAALGSEASSSSALPAATDRRRTPCREQGTGREVRRWLPLAYRPRGPG